VVALAHEQLRGDARRIEPVLGALVEAGLALQRGAGEVASIAAKMPPSTFLRWRACSSRFSSAAAVCGLSR
jgi:hypothetical protein